jgi:acyl carrier protein
MTVRQLRERKGRAQGRAHPRASGLWANQKGLKHTPSPMADKAACDDTLCRKAMHHGRYGYNAPPGLAAPSMIAPMIAMTTDTLAQIQTILDDVLGLGGRARAFLPATPLLGAVPELDSMAVVGVLNQLEAHFGFVADDDEIDGSTFATVGALLDYVNGKLTE